MQGSAGVRLLCAVLGRAEQLMVAVMHSMLMASVRAACN